MHLDTTRLAAYLDNTLDSSEHAAARAHLLTCATCAARLERLRADEQIIRRLAHAGVVPDVRAAVRAKRHRASPLRLLGRGAAFASALAVLLLFALLIGTRSGGAFGWSPDRLFVVDRSRGELVALDPATGAELASAAVGYQPRQVRYSRRADRLYVLDARGIAAVDPQTLTVVARWQPDQHALDGSSFVIDERRGALYVTQPDGAPTILDAQTLQQTGNLPVAAGSTALALGSDGSTIYALDSAAAQLTALTLPPNTAAARTWPLDGRTAEQQGWLVAGGQAVYVLHAGTRPVLDRIDVRDGSTRRATLDDGPTPWGLWLLDNGQLAVPRGDSVRGGVEIIDGQILELRQHLDPTADQHAVVVGPANTLFALNWLHGTVTRYDLSRDAPVWQIKLDGRQPWDGEYVPGGWHWPF